MELSLKIQMCFVVGGRIESALQPGHFYSFCVLFGAVMV